MDLQGIQIAIAALSAMGVLLGVFAFVQEHFFQKQIERERRELERSHPAE